MNRKQRRQQTRQQATITYVPVKDLKTVRELTDAECREVAGIRLAMNLLETYHPFHHRTVDDTIVDPDPTLEYLLSRIPAAERAALIEHWTGRIMPNAPAAVPVNRRFYGFDMFAKN